MPDDTRRPDRLPGQPDTNAGALRPGKMPADASGPDIDHPPQVQSRRGTGFDHAEAIEEREARDGTLPGGPDTQRAAERRPAATPDRDD
ncbi:hypothetical protein [Bordetella genomosp. 1]|uniref:MatE family transporter n=1 Tax=Bordetella genomosp. 1 TaxID=1395607 RepID=A0ABX4EY41_9BORD|nr:hypothetical protein [Bordetella genomosp. 1]MDQ8034583.1 hypothetical protein [Bordetella sp.]OZI64005.1 hypothetical protein CAL27_15575 [Bordetella genomosp. 1]